jgi:polysaccharide chain length determinant protein (PEP-CTERM system associated)
MLPGKTYAPEDIVQVLVRRWWLFALLAVVGAATAYGIARRLPDWYRSETLIMLEPQRVADEYVKSIAPAGPDERQATLETQLTSRLRLERIIAEFGLYGSPTGVTPTEDVVMAMRSDITVKAETRESFRVSYVSHNAKTAQAVVERLSSLFIEENARNRESIADNTNTFLDSQLADAKRQLIEQEKKLEQYRERYGGELPSQSGTNLQAMQNTQVQLQQLADVADRARERRLMLERQLADLQAEIPDEPIVAPPGSPENARLSTAQQLANARVQLDVLLARYKPDHPDVRSQRRTIRDLEAKLAAEQAQAAADPSLASKPIAPAELQRQRRIRDLKDQINDIDRQLEARQVQENKLRGILAQYEAKLDAMPKRESDLVELTRDYATLQQTYQSLLAKRQDAKIATNLERRNIGPQFRVLDPPKMPERPFSPNRLLIDIGGAVGGLVLAGLISALLEYRDSTFKSDDEVERLLNLRVLALVPHMTNQAKARVRRRPFKAAGIAFVLIGPVTTLVAATMQLPV